MRRPLLLLCVTLVGGCGGPAFTTATGEDGGGSTTDGAGDATLDGGADASQPEHDGGDKDAEGAADTGLADTGASDTGPLDGGSRDADTDATTVNDAGDDGDASPADFRCALTPPATTIFCCDFDESSSPPWTFQASLPNNAAATNTADTVHYVSAPHGYKAQVTTSISATAILDSLSAEVSPATPTAVKRVSYEFWVYVNSTAFGELTATSYPIGGLQFGGFRVDLVLSPAGLGLAQSIPDEGGTMTTTTPAGTLPATTWTHVTLECDHNATGSSVTVDVGGALQVTEPAIVEPSFTSIGVYLGILEIIPPTTGTNSLTFDNAIVHAYDQ